MANTDAPRGLKPVGTLGHSSYQGHIERFVILGADTTDTFLYDAVKLSSSGSDATGKFKAVVQATAGAAPCGVIVGIEPQPFTQSTSDDMQPVYIDGGVTTDQYVLVDIDPRTLYVIQEDSDTSTLAATSAGLNASLIVGSGDTTSGASAMEIDSSTAATTATLELKLMHLERREDNAIGANADWVVMINNHQFGSSTGTAGV